MEICVLSMNIEDIREKFADAETGVYWDVEDYPVTDFVSFDRNVRLALDDAGYRGKVSITAYGEKEPEDEYYKNAGITFVSRGSGRARMHRMLADMYFWAGKNRAYAPRNLMLISKYMLMWCDDDTFEEYISALHATCYNVLLAVPDDYKLQELPCAGNNYTVWRWNNLHAGGTPLDHSLVYRPPPPPPPPRNRRKR